MTKLIVGLLVIAAVGVIIFTTGDTTVDPVQDDQTTNKVSETNTDGDQKDFNEKTTLTALQKKGGNYMCTFTHNTEMGESKGTVYIAKEKIRGDFATEVHVGGMGAIESHMISDGESSYTWSSMSSDGFKIAIDQNATTENTNQVPTDQELDYTCVVWSVDQSKFSLPTNITFKTL